MLTLDNDLTGFVAISSALSSQQVFEGDGYMLLRWLDTGSYLLRQGGASVLGGTQLIDGWLGTMPLMMLLALPLDMMPLRVKICFVGTISAIGEAF